MPCLTDRVGQTRARAGRRRPSDKPRRLDLRLPPPTPRARKSIPPGMIEFQRADLNQVLDIYSELVNRTILRPATLPAPTITLTTKNAAHQERSDPGPGRRARVEWHRHG